MITCIQAGWLKGAIISSLKMGLVSSSFIQGCFVLCLVEIGPMVLKKKISNFCQCILVLSPLGIGVDPSFEQI